MASIGEDVLLQTSDFPHKGEKLLNERRELSGADILYTELTDLALAVTGEGVHYSGECSVGAGGLAAETSEPCVEGIHQGGVRARLCNTKQALKVKAPGTGAQSETCQARRTSRGDAAMR